jgi:hypothetical protein
MGKKPDFSGDFQRRNLTMWDNFSKNYFSQGLIPRSLEIICKVLREIYTPGG